MRLLLPISVSLLLAALAARTQTADDFFNSGAQLYISNNFPSALEKTEGGLKIYPDDVKLKKLEELLKQQQQSQQQQSRQNQQPNQQQQNSQSQQKPDDQKQNQSGQKKDDSQKTSEPKPSDEKQNGGNQPVAPGQMTPDEAKKLLDAQKGDEQLLPLKPQAKPQAKPQDNQKPVKDW